VQSEFPPLPFRTGSFDRVLCKNVLEYVDSAADTVKEMARVAAEGGTVVAIDSDWDMLALTLPEHARERSERILAAAKSIAVKEPKIGRMLYSLFRTAGLKDVRVEVFAGADTLGRAAPMLKASFARYARDSGQFAGAEVEQWLRDIDGAIAAGQFCRNSLCAERATERKEWEKPKNKSGNIADLRIKHLSAQLSVRFPEVSL
jgi:SAM-dependent methyltransferase